MDAFLDGIYQLKDSMGREQWEVFHEVPPHALTHYYSVMRRPMSLQMIRKGIKKGQYTNPQDFVRDLAQIAQNAKAYNDPSTIYWKDADALEQYVKKGLPQLSQELGQELIYPTIPSVLKLYEEEDSDSDGGISASRQRRRRSARAKPLVDALDQTASPQGGGNKQSLSLHDDDETEGRRKRGRPPTVDKPHEHRIKAILRAIRRVKDPQGRTISTWFDKVPDPRQYPTYGEIVQQPLAFDTIRKRIKRRQYPSVDDFLADVQQVFTNAKMFAVTVDQQILDDAVALENVMVHTAEEEKKKPDSAYADPDSNSKVARLPLDSVEHRGERYFVGDWVHISNPNDPAKPTVGQVFRLWRENGKTWANCCWYYRPEQTVHKFDKLFWENEVVKSGQYRDHLVDDILEKCFVMFITKYQRGRPKGIGQRSVYLCESRYNENEKTFNKIRTWKACIPDEIRTTDYEMDMFEKNKPLKKLYSPLRNELPPNARDDDPIPEPTMGDPMAPPLRGAVYKRPYDPNDPPEEPTPPSPPQSHQELSVPTVTAPLGPGGMMAGGGTSMLDSANGVGAPPNGVSVGAGPSPAMAQGNRAATPQMGPGQPLGGSPMYSYGQQRPGMPPQRQMFRPNAGTGGPAPIIPSAYILPEQYTNTLDEGSLAGVAKLTESQPLWFPSCPISVTHRVQVDPLPPRLTFDVDGETKQGERQAHGFGHSAKYLAWKLGKISN